MVKFRAKRKEKKKKKKCWQWCRAIYAGNRHVVWTPPYYRIVSMKIKKYVWPSVPLSNEPHELVGYSRQHSQISWRTQSSGSDQRS